MKIAVAFLISCTCVCSLFSQDVTQNREDESDGVAQPVNLLQQYYLNALTGQFKGFAAEDGHYFAQNKLELQTYYDLGLSYRYFADHLLRKQLQLPAGEGIMIKGVDAEGQGRRIGFKAGDIVLKVDNVAVDTQYKLVIELSNKRGKPRSIALRRSGTVQVMVVNLPEVDHDADGDKRLIIGVNVSPISVAMKAQLQTEGVLITGLTVDGPAINAGLQEYDIIQRIEAQKIADLNELKDVVQESNGEPVKVDYIRAGKSHSVELKPIKTDEGIEAGLLLSLKPALQIQVAQLPIVQPTISRLSVPLQRQLNVVIEPKIDDPASTDVENQICDILKQLKSMEQMLEQLKLNFNK